MKSLADWVRGLRKQLGLTQSQIAEQVGVTFVTVSRWENGEGRPSRLALRSLLALAQIAPGAGGEAAMEKLLALPDLPEMRRVVPRADSRYPPTKSRTPPHGLRTEESRASPGAPHGESAGILGRSRAFSVLGGDELVEIARGAVERRVTAGQLLYSEDEVLDSFYVVAEGRVKILRHSSSGKDFVLGFYGRGEVFGNVAMLSGKPHPASAEAVVDTKVLIIRSDDMLSFVGRHPESGLKLLIRLLEVVGMRQLRATRRLADMAVESVDRRVAYTLFTLSLEQGPVLPFTRQEIAEMSGTTTETAIRCIHGLKQRGIVRSFRRKLTIVDRAKLGLLMSDGYPLTWAP